VPAAEHREALREMKELLRAAMAKLPEEYRVVYQKRDLEGLAGGGRWRR